MNQATIYSPDGSSIKVITCDFIRVIGETVEVVRDLSTIAVMPKTFMVILEIKAPTQPQPQDQRR